MGLGAGLGAELGRGSPGCQDVVEGVAQLQQLVLVTIETVRRRQLLVIECPGTEKAAVNHLHVCKVPPTCHSPVLQQLAGRHSLGAGCQRAGSEGWLRQDVLPGGL